MLTAQVITEARRVGDSDKELGKNEHEPDSLLAEVLDGLGYKIEDSEGDLLSPP